MADLAGFCFLFVCLFLFLFVCLFFINFQKFGPFSKEFPLFFEENGTHVEGLFCEKLTHLAAHHCIPQYVSLYIIIIKYMYHYSQ